jgi:hypothetical protein
MAGWTIYYWAARWQSDGSPETTPGQLRERVRLLAGRKSLPTAAIIDSQSVRAAEQVARPSRGYDGGKKVQGRCGDGDQLTTTTDVSSAAATPRA